MRIDVINGTKVGIIGDVHLGRRFLNGVPLDRRGERELLVYSQFQRELRAECDVLIQVGDLFDKFVVPLDVIMMTVEAIRAEARDSEHSFYFMRGNHDASRDLEKVSAFQIASYMLRDLENVHFIDDVDVITVGEAKLGLVSWDPVSTAADMVKYLDPCDAVFGHWDVVDFSEDHHNLIPLKELKDKTKLVYTGHDHTPREYDEDGMHVIVTGSMQPYSHGEDPDHKMYVTLTLSELNAMESWDPLFSKCVRVILAEGESLPEDLECLQLTVMREKSTVDEIDVELGDFNMEKLFTEAFEESGVAPEITGKFLGMYKEQRQS